MKINYKNINQTLLKNIEKYIEFRDNFLEKNYIEYVQKDLTEYAKDLFNIKKKDFNKKIKLSIIVEQDFFSEKSYIGKNIVESPFFNGYFTITFRSSVNFFALYNNDTLFYTTIYRYNDRNRNNHTNYLTHEMKLFCRRRFINDKR